ncbi:hypothetical protein EON63_21400 [archaeon]|nr:MAG: hypothetical protein EON63_21400 [archaeon]
MVHDDGYEFMNMDVIGNYGYVDNCNDGLFFVYVYRHVAALEMMRSMLEDLRKDNLSQATHNVLLQDEIILLRSHAIETKRALQRAYDEYLLEHTLHMQHVRTQPDKVLASVREQQELSEKVSEQVSEKFLAGQMDLHTFLQVCVCMYAVQYQHALIIPKHITHPYLYYHIELPGGAHQVPYTCTQSQLQDHQDVIWIIIYTSCLWIFSVHTMSIHNPWLHAYECVYACSVYVWLVSSSRLHMDAICFFVLLLYIYVV